MRLVDDTVYHEAVKFAAAVQADPAIGKLDEFIQHELRGVQGKPFRMEEQLLHYAL